jgi:hypothetical protein
MRVSICWCDLKVRQWYGVGYGQNDKKNGMLGLFCAACPQPGVNMPENWENDPRGWVKHTTDDL